MSASWSSSSNADRHQPTPSLAGGRFLALLTAQLIVVGLFFTLSRQMFDLCLELVEQHSISVQRSQQITDFTVRLAKLTLSAPGSPEEEHQLELITDVLSPKGSMALLLQDASQIG